MSCTGCHAIDTKLVCTSCVTKIIVAIHLSEAEQLSEASERILNHPIAIARKRALNSAVVPVPKRMKQSRLNFVPHDAVVPLLKIE